jgi:hypothetical protein
MDIFKAEVSSEAGLGGADVAAHSARLTNLHLERWLVAVQRTQTERVLLGQHRIGG